MTQITAKFFIVGVTCLVSLASHPATAKNADGQWDNAPNAAWFANQHNAQGGYCCDGSDAHLFYGNYTMNPDGSVSVRIPDGELLIQPGNVIPYNPADPNPTGTAVWWYGDTPQKTYCFAIGTLG